MMENLAPLAAAVVIVLAGLALLASLVVIAVRALRRWSVRSVAISEMPKSAAEPIALELSSPNFFILYSFGYYKNQLYKVFFLLRY